jgi:hypothetical protein
MGAHQSPRSATVDWLTPPEWITALGPFGLDPCTPVYMPWRTALQRYSVADDGLTKEWQGRVWLNPPYGPPAVIEPWMARMAAHNFGTALIFARTDTRCWHRYVFPAATAVLFVNGRPRFHHGDGTRARANCGAPVALVAYGEFDARVLRQSGPKGCFIRLKETPP